jgi:hypothetical protein
VGETLVAVGGAFLAAGLLARVGRRIGLPTIPFFMVAGILFGPGTPGLVLVEEPEDSSCSRRSVWSCCCSTSAWSSRSTTSSAAAASCSPRGRST